MTKKRHKVFLGVGSNLGNRKANINKAFALLNKQKEIQIIKGSPVYETEPVGGPAQRKFLNCVGLILTCLSPEELLIRLKFIEEKMGRKASSGKWTPRIIDLDILFYERCILKTRRLIIPHPLLHRRRFVLEPFNDIAPGFKHPVLGKTIRRLFNELMVNEKRVFQIKGK